MHESNNERGAEGLASGGLPAVGALRRAHARACAALTLCAAGVAGRAREVAREQEGQGTTEYAILVGVLVVIAIIAIATFRDRIQTLWTSIADAVNGL